MKRRELRLKDIWEKMEKRSALSRLPQGRGGEALTSVKTRVVAEGGRRWPRASEVF